MSMEQYSLFGLEDPHEKAAALSSVLQLVRANMNRVADEHPTLSRVIISDLMTDISREAGVKLCRGNAKSVSAATLDKWLSPADREHPPSIQGLLAYCMVTGSHAPLEPMLKALGCEIMTKEDRRLRDYARALVAERKARQERRKLEGAL